MVGDTLFFMSSDMWTHLRQDLVFKNQATNSRKNEGGQFVNDLLRTEFHKYAHIQNALRIGTYAILQEIYDQVHKGTRYHLGPRLTHSHRITSVIIILYFSIRVMCICFHSSHSAIYGISPCSTSILPQTNRASPFRRTPDLWYTSMHVERCTISPVWGLGEAEGSILDNTDVHFRPTGLGFHLCLRWPQSRSFSRRPPHLLIVALAVS
jgi:hypothetical protein